MEEYTCCLRTYCECCDREIAYGDTAVWAFDTNFCSIDCAKAWEDEQREDEDE